MRIHTVATASTLGCALLLAQGPAAQAAEIKLISATPLRPAILELAPQFERATGHKLVATFVAGPTVAKRVVDAGETFDVVISLQSVIEALIKEGRLAAATRADVASGVVGVGVRKGAPKPDIGTVEAFKRTLLNAQSVAHSSEGASGAHFKAVLDRLGIAEQMQAKLRPATGEALAQSVPKGEAEMIVVTSSIILAYGADLVGPIPAELQTYIRFAAAVGSETKDADAAKALIRFITSPEAAAVIKAKGLEPGAR